MKIRSLILMLTVALSSSIALAEEERKDPRVGENTDCVKCIDIVDQARNFNPDKIVWKSDKPVCQTYTKDGSCSMISKSNETDLNVK